jgi:hypothetical protein
MAKIFIQNILQKGRGKQHRTKKGSLKTWWGEKPRGKLEGDQAMHLQGWTTKHIKVS